MKNGAEEAGREVQTFKTQSGLPGDSVLDQPTRDAIIQAYGSSAVGG